MNLPDDERKRVLRRLKKILALTESSNPGEAAAAMQQANTLMQRYGFTSMDAQVSDVQEVACELSGAEVLRWEHSLISVVAKAMGVMAMKSSFKPVRGKRRPRGSIIFVGENSRAEIAAYAFESLRRKLRRDVKASMDAMLQKYAQNSDAKVSLDDLRKVIKIKPAQRDAYAFTWCKAVKDKVSALAPSVSPCVALYIESRVTALAPADTPQKPERACKARTLDPIGSYMYLQGMRDGRDVDLHRGVGQVHAPAEIAYERPRGA